MKQCLFSLAMVLLVPMASWAGEPNINSRQLLSLSGDGMNGTLSYDEQGRAIKYIYQDSHERTTYYYTYGEGFMKITSSTYDTTYEITYTNNDFTYTITDGKVTSATISYEGQNIATMAYGYDGSGHLTSIAIIQEYGGATYSQVKEYTWDGDNVTSAVSYLDVTGQERIYQRQQTYTHNNIETQPFVHALFGIDLHNNMFNGDADLLGLYPYLGKLPKKLLSNMVNIRTNEGNERLEHEYTYDTDTDGDVVAFTNSGEKLLTFEWGEITTGIAKIQTPNKNSNIYDLSGRKVKKPMAGPSRRLYIIDGKKMIK